MSWLEALGRLSGTRTGTKIAWLLLSVAAGVMFWRIAGDVSMRLGPDAALMENAADRMRRASEVIREARAARGVTPSKAQETDGPEFNVIHADDDAGGAAAPRGTTSVASPRGKRTVASPDTAALFSRLLRKAGLHAGDTVAVVLSDAYIGGNVAALSAIEAYGLRSRVVSVLRVAPVALVGDGVNRTPFTWLDAEAAVRTAGVWNVRSLRVVLPDDARTTGASGAGARTATRDAITRAGVPLVEAQDFAATVRESAAILDLGPTAATKPALLVNMGGSRLALGDCLQTEDLPHGVISHPLPCRSGVPGLIQIALDKGIPVLNAFMIRENWQEGPRAR